MDTRTEPFCDELVADGGKDRLRPIVGLPIIPYFAGTKMKWLLDNVEGLRAAAEAGTALAGTIDTWLVWNLTGGPAGTGVHVTDVTNASRTLLMSLEKLNWDESCMDLLKVPRAMLPEIKSSSEMYGSCCAGTGLEGVSISGILGDQHAALFGQTCFTPGEVKNTYGTGCFMVMHTGTDIVPSKSGLLTTLAYKLGDAPACYALEGSVAIAGSLVQWLRDNLGIINDAAEVETLAAEVDDNGGVYIVPAFAGLYAPHWRSDARGVICGLTGFATKKHFCRASLEAVCYQTKEVVQAMEKDSGVTLSALKVDGGMTANKLLMQFQSDIINTTVLCPTVAETTALGAAYAAGLAVGFWKDLDEIKANWGKDREFAPNMEEATRAKLFMGWTKAVSRANGWTTDVVAQL